MTYETYAGRGRFQYRENTGGYSGSMSLYDTKQRVGSTTGVYEEDEETRHRPKNLSWMN